MPIYEYRRADGTTFEKLESIMSDPLTVDPDTGQTVERVLHPPAVHFKGSGFYNTDYGTKKRARETKEAGEKSSSSSSDTKSDGKKGDTSSSSSSTTSDSGSTSTSSSSSSASSASSGSSSSSKTD
jgi:putative FmdB family regulatory protein